MADYGFKNIVAWQRAHAFVLAVYQSSASFPDFEKRGLWSQFTRAAVSVAANIAEGYKKISKADKLRFINISQGSLEECRYYVILAHDLHYISDETEQELNYKLEGVSWCLNAYAQAIVNDAGIKD